MEEWSLSFTSSKREALNGHNWTNNQGPLLLLVISLWVQSCQFFLSLIPNPTDKMHRCQMFPALQIQLLLMQVVNRGNTFLSSVLLSFPRFPTDSQSASTVFYIGQKTQLWFPYGLLSIYLIHYLSVSIIKLLFTNFFYHLRFLPSMLPYCSQHKVHVKSKEHK